VLDHHSDWGGLRLALFVALRATAGRAGRVDRRIPSAFLQLSFGRLRPPIFCSLRDGDEANLRISGDDDYTDCQRI
jgi:hypothetical protein